jgi:urea transport system permease protein
MKPLCAILKFVAIGLILLCLPPRGATAQNREEVINGLAAESRNTIMHSINAIPELGDKHALAALLALKDGRLGRDAQGRAVIVDVQGRAGRYADSGQAFEGDLKHLEFPVINNRVRRMLKMVSAEMSLFADDRGIRLRAARELARRPRQDSADRIRKALKQEKDAEVRDALTLALALTQINSTRTPTRLKAIAALGQSGNDRFIALLKPILSKNADGQFNEKNEKVRAAARKAVAAIQHHVAMVQTIQNLFYGISLGSVLLLAALGLAITFGLMGVINMAHGEMLMLGAYATYVTQNLFRLYLPGAMNWYLLAAVPVAFTATCLVGIVLERCVIRFLYGRPLETLLATWGISLMLIQTVRVIFGAQNVEVANPAWLSGATHPITGLVLTYNRLAIIGFVIVTVALVYGLLNYTSLGLKMRCVTQNRSMAAAMGIHTSRVDMWTFGIGSAIAGLGGVALSQIGNVGPELGQGYIVDSFMVVVLGGVGKIAGTICGAMGLGIINKFIEPHMGAVLGKILLLIFVILFIQKRPQGMFAQKARV